MILVWWFGLAVMIGMLVFYFVNRPLSMKFRVSRQSNCVWSLHICSGVLAAAFSVGVILTHRPLPQAILVLIFDAVHFCTICLQLNKMYWGESQLISTAYVWLSLTKLVCALQLLLAVLDEERGMASPVTSRSTGEWAVRYGLVLQAFSYQRFLVFAFRHATGNYYYSTATILCGSLTGFPAIGPFNALATWLLVLISWHYVPKWVRPNTNEEDKLYLFSKAAFRETLLSACEEYGKEELLALGKRRDQASARMKASILAEVLDIDGDGLDKQDWVRLWHHFGMKNCAKSSDQQLYRQFYPTIFQDHPTLTHGLYDELVGALRNEVHVRRASATGHPRSSRAKIFSGSGRSWRLAGSSVRGSAGDQWEQDQRVHTDSQNTNVRGSANSHPDQSDHDQWVHNRTISE